MVSVTKSSHDTTTSDTSRPHAPTKETTTSRAMCENIQRSNTATYGITLRFKTISICLLYSTQNHVSYLKEQRGDWRNAEKQEKPQWRLERGLGGLLLDIPLFSRCCCRCRAGIRRVASFAAPHSSQVTLSILSSGQVFVKLERSRRQL